VTSDSIDIVALAEIAQLLQSTDDRDGRLHRALEILARVLPYERCALLVGRGDESSMLAIPAPASERERQGLTRDLGTLMRTSSPPDGRRVAPSSHLALPLVAGEEEHGILRVERGADSPYDERALRVLSVVAAQIGTYVAYCDLVAKQRAQVAAITRANEFRKLLVGIVSHDLRNPLSAISNGTSLLLARIDSPRDIAVIGRIGSSAHRALRIIHDLLDMTREQASGTFPVTLAPGDASAVVREIVAEARLAHPDREIELDGADAPIVGTFDADRLAQAIGNLLANAAQHSQRGSAVRVALRADDDELEVTVQNAGTVAPELVPTLFDPFSRGVEAAEPGHHAHGLGLGLYIVAQVTRAHGGRAEVRSRDERTEFTISVPRQARAGT
jgi:signal transduction histidine kinase